jgi:glucose-6-phosphate isomerase
MPDDIESRLEGPIRAALESMERIEAGDIANGTENRRVGHYWLRAPELAPTGEIGKIIEETKKKILEFTAAVRSGSIQSPTGPFTDLLFIGIGGSVLGPQLILSAFPPDEAAENGPRKIHFLDNTDPDGFLRVLRSLGDRLGRTLICVTSKSGTTPEPCNALRCVEAALGDQNLTLAPRAVAITCEGSELDRRAREEGWLARFPMWDWVGGRTSITSAVGLLPAALGGVAVDEFLAGAAAMDRLTRQRDRNPALRIALAWYFATNGTGDGNMAIIPYRDALTRLTPYLQQLVMESLGKRQDRDGALVQQGLTVYGNRGSTDQHSYVQQLRDGPKNFFVTFIEVLRGQEKYTNSALRDAENFLRGFLLGTREALADDGRQSLTITLRELTPFTLGLLVALYERAVGFYAEFINVNAYDQPGVEAGKKAADRALQLRLKIVEWLKKEKKSPHGQDAVAVAEALGQPECAEMAFKWLECMRAQGRDWE